MTEQTGDPIIELDFTLFGKVLSEYAHLMGHIDYTDFITVKDIAYDADDQILTAFVKINKETIN